MDIQGWTDGEGPLSILPLLEDDSDDEDEDGVEQSVYGENDGDDDYFDAIHTKSKKRKVRYLHNSKCSLYVSVRPSNGDNSCISVWQSLGMDIGQGGR